VTPCDGQGGNRGTESGSRASTGGRTGAPLPRGRGPVDRADCRSPRPLAGHRQGVLLRPDRRQGARRQGTLCRRVPRLRRLHATAERQGRCLRLLQALPPGAIERRWTRERVVEAMLAWRRHYGRLPSSYDWSRTHARRRGGDALARLAEGEWPAASVVTRLFGTWSGARAVAAEERTREPLSAALLFGRGSISLPKPRESTAISEDLRGGERKPEPIDLQVLLTAPADFAHNSGR
jgi:hypothetical protein